MTIEELIENFELLESWEDHRGQTPMMFWFGSGVCPR